MSEKGTENNNGKHFGRKSVDGGANRKRIKPFPQSTGGHSGRGESAGQSESNSIRESSRSSGLLTSGTTSPPSDGERGRGYSVGDDGIVELHDRPSQQPDRGVRNSTTNHSANENRETGSTRTTIPTRRTSSETNIRTVLQREVNEGVSIDVNVSDNPPSSLLDLDTKSSLNLNHDVTIVPTRMMERQMLNQSETEHSPEIELTDEHEGMFGTPPEPPPKKPQGKKRTNGKKQPPIKTENVETTVIPAKPYKFDKETRQQLNDVFVYSSKLLDTALDFGCGVDTELVPIWEISEQEAEVFVRIMERRAARSEIVRDKVVPKMLESRDYVEAGMIVMPRAITTVKTIVDQGGVKPRFFNKKEGQ